MAKIIVNKNDGAETIVKKIQASEDQKIILVVPKQSAFGEEVSNFELLREAATELDKDVAIESVDENVLALARANDFSAIHPLFEGSAKGKVSDILPAKGRRTAVHESAKGSTLKRSKEPVIIHKMEEVAEEEPVKEEVVEVEERRPRYEDTYEPEVAKKGHGIFMPIVLAIATIAAVYFIGLALFSHADVVARFPKSPWQDTSTVVASAGVNKVNLGTNTIPAQSFVQTKTATQLFPASGKSQVSVKATGKITIHNAYSSQQQTLVATTRFETSDGKILRLVSQVNVPGAKIENGKIIPSTVIADVVADKPGDAYNVGPLDKLVIPGFKGSPKYDGFYGSIETPLSGGFVGIKPVPTTADITSAKAKTSDLLKAAFDAGFFAGIPKDFKILDGASNLQVTKLTVDTNTDKDGNFTILGEAKLTALGFREVDLGSLLEAKAKMGDPNASFASLNLEYSNVKPDFSKSVLSMSVKSDGIVVPAFDAEAFKDTILGKTGVEARDLLSRVPELSDGKVNLSPFWLSRIPQSASRVKVTVE